MKIVIIPGLTLPQVAERDLQRIRRAGGGAEVVVSDPESVLTEIVDADVVLGFVTRPMYRGREETALGSRHRFRGSIASSTTSSARAM